MTDAAPPSAASPGTSDPAAARAADLLLGLLVAAAAWLRFHALGERALFGDEIHSLTLARGLGANWLGDGVLLASGGYAPFAAWARGLIGAGWLDEGTLRLPAALAGTLLVAGAAIAARRNLPRAEAVLATGLMACSPYLVFQSREARGYPIAVLAFGLAAWGVARWLSSERPGPTWRLPAAVVAASVATGFDTAAGPSLLVLAAGALGWMGVRGGLAARRNELLAAAATALVCIGLLLPTLRGVIDEAGRASAEAQASWHTAVASASLAVGLPAFAALALLVLGGWRLHARFPHFARAALGLVAAQALVLAALQPRTLEVPWVAIRYVAHLLPVAVLAVALAVAPSRRFAARHARLALAAAVALIAAYGAHEYRLGRYDALRDACSVAHPMTWDGGPQADAAVARAMPAFYRDVLPGLPPGGVIEAPLLVSHPLYEWYRRQHERRCATAAAGTGLFQATVAPEPGMRLRRTLFAEALPAGASPADRYLIVHKHPWLEMARVSAALLRAGAADHAIDPRAAAAIFANQPIRLSPDHPLQGDRIHDDAELAVYELRESAR